MQINRIVPLPQVAGPGTLQVTVLAFDTNAELLWVGNDHVSNYRRVRGDGYVNC